VSVYFLTTFEVVETSAIRPHSYFGLTETDGFVPGATAEPDLAANVAELVSAGRIKEAQDLLTQIQSGNKMVGSLAPKARPNVNGSTQGPVSVPATRNSNGGRFDVSSQEGKMKLDAARKSMKTGRKADIQGSHDARNVGLFSTNSGELAKTGDVTNFDNVTISRFTAKQEDAQLEAITPDPQMLAANKRALAVKREREARLAAGQGNLSDLRAKFNALNS
jgi:hypothetical protein